MFTVNSIIFKRKTGAAGSCDKSLPAIFIVGTSMILVFFFISSFGFSLEAMQVKEFTKVSEKLQQDFWAVCDAMRDRDLDKAQGLVTANPRLLQCVDAQKKTLLHLSIEAAWAPFSLWLIRLPDCQLNVSDDKQRRPLHVAMALHENEVVAELVKRGVAFSLLGQKAAAKDSPGVGQQLWKALRAKKNNLLHDAIEKRDGDLAILVQQHSELIDSPNADGNTPLHCAVACLDESAVNVMLAAGASIAVANNDNCSPLHLAAAADSTQLCSMVVNRLGSLSVSDVQHMLAKSLWVRNSLAQQARALLNEEKNFERHDEGLVTITNDTTWRLKLSFALAGKTGEIIIMPGDQFLLYAELKNLSSLEVKIYGKQWQYAQWAPLDIYKPWREEVTREPRYTFEIKIAGDKSALWQYVTPFVISSHGNGNEMYQPASRVSKDCLIAEAFPSVMASLKKLKAITARNFLQVSSTASEEAVRLAYDRLKILWKRQRTIANKAYVDRVCALLDLAYQQLIDLKSGLTFPFDTLEKIAPLDVVAMAHQPALQCVLSLHTHMGAITPEILTIFLKKFRREEQVRLLRMRDSSDKTAAYLALEKGNIQLYTYLMSKDLADAL